ncbi:MAG: glycosyltransferase family 4 protein [Terriglobia bacterium]
MGNKNLLVFIEAATVTGPAKNLLDFCRVPNLPLNIRIATFSRNGGDNEFVRAFRNAGVDVTVIPEKGSFDPGITKAMAALIADFKPAIIQTHAVKSHFVLALSGLRKRAKWVAFHHGYTSPDLKMRVYNQLDRWSLRKPDRLVTVSEAFKRQLVAQGVDSSRISILQNSVSPDWAESVRTARLRLTPGNAKTILAIGRLSREKAHSDLIAAFHILRRDQPTARLIIVGDGPERANLERMAGQGITFFGQTLDVASRFAEADVMVLPSITEGSPNVLLEAMACGVPSVATSVGGVPEIVTDGESALLVPARDPEQLAAAIARLLTDQTLSQKIVTKALDLIRLHHSVESRAQWLCGLYENL